MKRKFFVGLLAIILCLCLIGCGSSNNTTSSSNSGPVSTTTEKPQQELTESEKMITKVVALMDEGLAYDTGNYTKEAVTPGTYVFTKFNGSGSYYCENDAAGNIVDNENFDSFGYVKVHGVGDLETSGVLVNVTALEKLGVSGAKQLYEIINNQTDYNQGGYYKVGVDIEPGNYIIQSIGGSGYYAIMSGPVSDSRIIKNDNFSGEATVKLKDGQYITISRAMITKQ